MRIYDGRPAFKQWDVNMKITDDSFKVGEEVHFYNGTTKNALVLITYEYEDSVVVDVPNIFLTTHLPITVYKCFNENGCSCTTDTCKFDVEKRPKPDDYVYTETEVKNYGELEDRIKELEDAIENVVVPDIDLSAYSTTEEIARDYLPQMQIIDEREQKKTVPNNIGAYPPENSMEEFGKQYDRLYMRDRSGVDRFIALSSDGKRIDSPYELGEPIATVPVYDAQGNLRVNTHEQSLNDDCATPWGSARVIKETAENAEKIAKGAQKALSYSNYKAMIDDIQKEWELNQYPIGQNIYIGTLNVPDLWISDTESRVEEFQYYTYTSDADFIAELLTEGRVQVGLYYLSALETQKVDLTQYYDKDEIDAMIGDISSALSSILEMQNAIIAAQEALIGGVE